MSMRTLAALCIGLGLLACQQSVSQQSAPTDPNNVGDANMPVGLHALAGEVTGLVPLTEVAVHHGGTELTVRYPATRFAFALLYADGTPYNLSLDGNSRGLACTLRNGQGHVGDANLPPPRIDCQRRLAFAPNQDATVVLGQADFVSTGGPLDGAHLSQPYSIYVAADGSMYVGDSNNFRALGYAEVPATNGAAADLVLGQNNLNERFAWANGAPEPQQMQPCGLSGDANHLLVTDCYMHRALIFSPLPKLNRATPQLALGQPDLQSNGSACSATSLFGPMGAAMVDGKVIIADAGNHRVLIWHTVPQQSGVAADVVVGQADFDHCDMPLHPTSTRLNRPSGVWSDGTRLLVADTFNNRVLAWNTLPTANGQGADAVLGQDDFTSNTSQPGSTTSLPIAVTYDGSQVIVSEYGANRISVWNAFPTQAQRSGVTAILGQADGQSTLCNQNSAPVAPGPNTLCAPIGLQVYGNRLIAAEFTNNRVVIYESQ